MRKMPFPRNTGAIAGVDFSVAYSTNDAGFGTSPMVGGSAYINNDTNPATGTALYNIEAARDVLVIQAPPNTGTLITVGALGVDVSDVAGFDVAGRDGTAYASLLMESDRNSNNDRAGLYAINLMTGAATFLGQIGGPKPLCLLHRLRLLQCAPRQYQRLR